MMNFKSSSLSVFRVLSIGGLLISGMLGCAYIYKSPEPSSMPIKLDKIGVVADFEFEVKKPFVYWYSMNFSFQKDNQLERLRVRNLLGGAVLDKTGNPLEPGIPTPINLTIFAICHTGKDVEIYSKDINPILTSWNGSSFGKDIGYHILNPGLYRAHLVNKRASPEFSSIPITFQIGMSAKTSFEPSKDSIRNEPCQQ